MRIKIDAEDIRSAGITVIRDWPSKNHQKRDNPPTMKKELKVQHNISK